MIMMRATRAMMREGTEDERGMSLVETMMAMLILLVGMLTLAQMVAFSVMASKTYGRDAGKTTLSARDRMDQLTNLDFSALTAGGTVAPATPAEGYSDYLDESGTVIADPTTAAYVRQWQISDETGPIKKIVVSVASKKSFKLGSAPSTILVTEKTP